MYEYLKSNKILVLYNHKNLILSSRYSAKICVCPLLKFTL